MRQAYLDSLLVIFILRFLAAMNVHMSLKEDPIPDRQQTVHQISNNQLGIKSSGNNGDIGIFLLLIRSVQVGRKKLRFKIYHFHRMQRIVYKSTTMLCGNEMGRVMDTEEQVIYH